MSQWLEISASRYTIDTTSGRVFSSIGKEVGSVGSDGYFRLTIYGPNGVRSTVRRGRLVFWAFYGYWPKKELDHIDRVKTNDAISNLREVDHITNIINRRLSDRELPPGVHYYPRMKTRPFFAKSKGRHIGHFATVEEAHRAFLKHWETK